jgi:hypothetical protein
MEFGRNMVPIGELSGSWLFFLNIAGTGVSSDNEGSMGYILAM